MTMNFRYIKAKLVTMLGNAASGNFRVIGYQEQGQAATEVKDDDRTIQVYYSRGSFPKSAGGMSGPVTHEISFKIDFTASKAAKGDLATILNPASTPAQIAAALAAFKEAAEYADNSIDEMIDLVYQIIMDARNIDFVEPPPGPTIISSRWIEDIEKDDPIPRGSLVVLTAAMNLTCKIYEDVPGETGTAATIFDTELEPWAIDGQQDDDGGAGVLVDNT